MISKNKKNQKSLGLYANLTRDNVFWLISVEKLQEHWEEALSHVNQRKNQLDDMLLECRQFDEMHAEFERWLGQIEEDLHANPVRASGTNIDQQIAKQKVRIIHSVNRK